MRPNSTAVIEAQTNFAGKSTKMSIDTSALDHIIGQLTDLYSDPALAVIREYSTNAWDSHQDAGNTDPIVVTLPTVLRRKFSVEDFGVGLSTQELDDIYSKYGASTKRDSDDVVGMLGFGCKSALTYADQFTIRARKDGLETMVNVVKGKNGVGELKYMSVDVSTKERNGVLVEVQVSNVNEFNRKAKEFYRFWRPGSVLVNGEQPKLSEDGEPIWLDADTAVFRSNRDYYGNNPRKDYIVMGNVGYPIAYDKVAGNGMSWDRGISHQYSFVRWVPIGSVNFPPNREELQYTELTRKSCKAAVQFVKTNMRKHLEKEIDLAPNAPAAFEKANEFAQMLTGGNGYGNTLSAGMFKYKGEPIPVDHLHDEKSALFLLSSYGNAKGVDLNPNSRIMFTGHTRYRPGLVVTGFTPDRLTPYRRNKLVEYYKQQGLSETVPTLLTTATSFDCKWIEFKTVDWATIDAIKLVKNRNMTVTYQHIVYDPKAYNKVKTEQVTIDALDNVDVIYYSNADIRDASSRNMRYSYGNAMLPMDLFAYNPALQVVQLGKGSWKKFEREHVGEFTHVNDWIEEEAKRLTAGITKTQRVLLNMDGTQTDVLRMLKGETLHDPELTDLIAEFAKQTDIIALRDKIANLRKAMRWASGKSFTLPDADSPLDSYPLLRYAVSDRKAAIEYVNSVFKYRTAKP